MTLRGDAKFKGKVTYDLKNVTTNLINFRTSCQNFPKLHFNWIVLSKACKDLIMLKLLDTSEIKDSIQTIY